MAKLYTEHIDLYDIAFGWDIGEALDWLLEGSARDAEAFSSPAAEAAGC